MDKPPGTEPPQLGSPDFDELSRNIGLFLEGAGKATAAYFKPSEDRPVKSNFADEAAEAVKTFGQVAESWMADPQKTLEAQAKLGSQFLELWASTLKRAQGESSDPIASPEARD